MTEVDPFDAMMGGNFARTAKFDSIGDSHEGVIVTASMEHAREYIEGQPGAGGLLYWHNKRPLPVENDQPVMEPRLTFQTNARDDEKDDGRRSVTINKPLLKEALQKAVAGAGAKRPAIGGYIRFTRIEDQPPRRGSNKARGWSVEYLTPEQHAAEGALGEAVKPTRKSGNATADDDPFATA